MAETVIHVFIGTKAQYIKMAPLLRLMDSGGVDYRLIDSGQHAELAVSYRNELGLRDPDHRMGSGRDVVSIPQAVWWALKLSARLASRSRLRDHVFGGRSGVCVVHGDTPTTLLSTLLAKRAGLAVAQVEAGLRTRRLLHPFPEEIVRIVVGRLADVLFAPGPEAASNLRRSGVKGRIVEQPSNTVLETVSETLDAALDTDGDSSRSAAVVTIHRVENVHHRTRRNALVEVVETLAAAMPVRWVMNSPTSRALGSAARQRLAAAGVEVAPLTPRGEFLPMVASAPLVITDGGTIQEECAALGVPTLLWCDRTGRPDGVGDNVVVSRYDRLIVEEFLSDPQQYRRPRRVPTVSPSVQILAELDAWR